LTELAEDHVQFRSLVLETWDLLYFSTGVDKLRPVSAFLPGLRANLRALCIRFIRTCILKQKKVSKKNRKFKRLTRYKFRATMFERMWSAEAATSGIRVTISHCE
jgi:hypothetical protein